MNHPEEGTACAVPSFAVYRQMGIYRAMARERPLPPSLREVAKIFDF